MQCGHHSAVNAIAIGFLFSIEVLNSVIYVDSGMPSKTEIKPSFSLQPQSEIEIIKHIKKYKMRESMDRFIVFLTS